MIHRTKTLPPTPSLLAYLGYVSLLSLLPALAPPAVRAGEGADVEALLERVASTDAQVRYKARFDARTAGAAAVPGLGRLLGSPPKLDDAQTVLEIQRTARNALEQIVHHSAREGAEAEAAAVSAELAKLLAPAASSDVKREVLHLIAHSGKGECVPAVAALLGDGDVHVRETARLALERIPAPEAAQALEAAARAAPPDRRADFIFSLGKKGDASAVPFILQTARESEGKLRVYAFEALSRLEAAEAVPAFEEAIGSATQPDRGEITGEYLRLASALERRGEAEKARAMYTRVLRTAELDVLREQALHRLAAAAASKGVEEELAEAVVAGLGDPSSRVRAGATRVLETLEGDAVTERLLGAYEAADGALKPVLLRAIARKSPPRAAPLLEEAAGSRDAELKVTALDLQGRLDDPALEDMLLTLAREGSEPIRPVAARGYLLVAKRKRAEALAMLATCLELPAQSASEADRRAALEELARAGDPGSLDILQRLAGDAALGAQAAEAYVDLAGRVGRSGNADLAAARLLEVVKGRYPRDLRNRALEALVDIGRDPQAETRKGGFLVDWWLVGPMESRGGRGLETRYFPEDVIDVVHEQRIGPRRFRWQRYQDISLDGIISLVPVFRRSERRIAYAYTELNAARPMDVHFKLGSDDGVALWVNGERLHLNDVERTLKVDEDTVPAKLRPGKNTVLLKISNRDATWQFACRLTGPDGAPLDVEELRAP